MDGQTLPVKISSEEKDLVLKKEKEQNMQKSSGEVNFPPQKEDLSIKKLNTETSPVKPVEKP